MSRIGGLALCVAALALASLALLTCTVPACAGDAIGIDENAVPDPLSGNLDEGIEEEPAGFPDPLESVNRGTLRFNQGLDRWLFDPITKVYSFIVPDPAKRAVRRIFVNLDSPGILANDMLQGEWKDATTTVARFVLNTSVGLAGIFDPASALGMEGHYSDFGQTLALAGVKSGPFLMIPALGPTTTRDGIGFLVDALFRPTTYLLGPGDQIVYTAIEGGGSGIATREANHTDLRILKESSLDYYAALRNAYYQNRNAEIWNHREHRRPGEPKADDGADAGIHEASLPDTSCSADPPREVDGSPIDSACRNVSNLAVDGD